jgi:hypothetical protein
MRRKAVFLGVMALVAVVAAFGMWREVTPSRGSAPDPPSPIQPFAPDWQFSGSDTTALGANVVSYIEGDIPRGQRIAIPWIFSAPQFGVPLAMDGLDGTSFGGLLARLDVQCDGNPTAPDYLAPATPDANSQDYPGSYPWVKTTTTVLPANNNAFLIPLVPPYPWLLRQTVTADTFFVANMPAPASVILNTVFTNVPWSANGGANTATTKNGGDPRAWTKAGDGNCIDTPQDSWSNTATVINPVALGDTGGPCGPQNAQGTPVPGTCAEAAVYNFYTDDTVTLDPLASATPTVHKTIVNNGPDAGTFKDHWEIELTNSTVMDAGWGSTGTVKTLDTAVGPLDPGTSTDFTQVMNVVCKAGSAGTEGLVVLKNVLWPVVSATPAASDTKEYYPDDNAQVFVMKVVCAPALPRASLVDKAVIWIKPTAVTPAAGYDSVPDQVNLPVGGGASATVKLREVKVNNATTDVIGNEWLVAESANVVHPSGADITMTWLPDGNATVTQDYSKDDGRVAHGIGTAAAGTAPDVGITFPVTEPPGQSDILANLQVSCTAGTPQGRYSVVVKAIDAPAGELKPADNAQRYVLKVNCWNNPAALNAAKDGMDDGDGIYPKWIIAQSNPDSRQVFTSPPSFVSDTGPDSKLQNPIGGYVERVVLKSCYWMDTNGCTGTNECDGSLTAAPTPHPKDGWIDDAESRQDGDIPGGYAAIDADADCLVDQGLPAAGIFPALTAGNALQPGHPVDLPPADSTTIKATANAAVTTLTSTAGTANAAVTTSATAPNLTDSRVSWAPDQWVDAVVTTAAPCTVKTMTVTGNTATTLSGTAVGSPPSAWSGGGKPGDGCAYTIQMPASTGYLTDPRASWTVNEFTGKVVTSNGKTLTVASNTATRLTGTADWSTANPGEGKAYVIAGLTGRTMCTGPEGWVAYSGAPLQAGAVNSKSADHDCDGLNDGIEVAWGSNPLNLDTDSDGAPDLVEMFDFTNPNNPDTDGDGFLDAPSGVYGDNNVATYGAIAKTRDNCPATWNPTQLNSDSHLRKSGTLYIPTGVAGNPNKDKMGDACDPDNDNDGLPDAVEIAMGTDPLNPDSNGNHCVDGTELLLATSLNPATVLNGTATGVAGATLTDSTAPFTNALVNQSVECNGKLMKITSVSLDGKTLTGSTWVPATGPAAAVGCKYQVYSLCEAGTLTLDEEKFFRGCHWNVGLTYSGGVNDVVDPEGDGQKCDAAAPNTDGDNDNFRNAFTNVFQPEIPDITEIEGYNTNPANVDTDSDGCYDFAQITDVNGDGVVNTTDIRIVAGKTSSSATYNAADWEILDVNKDNVINTSDIRLVAGNQCIVHGQPGFGCVSASSGKCFDALITK